MSSYTTTLRRLMDPEANTAGYQFVKGHYENGVWVPAQIDKIEYPTGFSLWEEGDKAFPLIFDDEEWEGYDATYRSSLQSKIVDYYWMYEIGSETPQLFKQRLNARMRLIMPYYNQLFKAQVENFKDFDPNTFYRRKDYKGKTTKQYQGGTQTSIGERKDYDRSGQSSYGIETDGSAKTKTTQYNFDTPQNLSSLNVDDPDHMSSAFTAKVETPKTFIRNGKLNNDGSFDDTDSGYTSKSAAATDTMSFQNRKDIDEFDGRYDEEKGFNSSRYTQYKEYLEGLKNIEQMIIDELRDLFMLVY